MRPGGLEPPTSWSVARRSIQLSYGRDNSPTLSMVPLPLQAAESLRRGVEDPPQRCPRQDSNLYAVSGTGPSNQPVYQFQHVGEPRLLLAVSSAPDDFRFQRTRALHQCSRRDSNPHGVAPTGS